MAYGTLAKADTYFENDLSGTWAGYSTPNKNKARETATKQIDRLQLKGEKYQYAPTQTLEFPRTFATMTGVLIFDEDLTNGGVIVPVDVEEASYIQAKFLLDANAGKETASSALLAGKTSVSIGSTSESFDKSLSPVDIKTGISKQAMNILEKYILAAW